MNQPKSQGGPYEIHRNQTMWNMSDWTDWTVHKIGISQAKLGDFARQKNVMQTKRGTQWTRLSVSLMKMRLEWTATIKPAAIMKWQYNYFTSSYPHHDIYTFCYWQIFWHSIWHIFWHFIWHIFWHSIGHIFWHSTWHIFCNMFWHIFWHSI